MNILIVENDIDESSVLTESIQRWGYNIANARTGKEALKKFTHEMFDLILLDIFLSDGEGHRLIPQFKQLCPGIGIITMTGYNTRELEMEVRQQGILYYMIKPFDPMALKELLDHISRKYSDKADNEYSRTQIFADIHR